MIDEKALMAAARAIDRIAWRDSKFEPLNANDDAQDLARAAVQAYLAHLAEAGRVIVPVEPTQEMLDAAATETHWEDQYAAAIAARSQNEGE